MPVFRMVLPVTGVETVDVIADNEEHARALVQEGEFGEQVNLEVEWTQEFESVRQLD